ncbi:hypothetical protein NPX13_g10313 [Xylaria arbuscula]|uniref:Cytochrome P450 n=1 Tax=Xylaria arbuscula TaxID=114810 RepID=A0A9W8N517_9PEZI|nr:hypothetical protein NPX13_g10313 [Xylaria arbuscula]
MLLPRENPLDKLSIYGLERILHCLRSRLSRPSSAFQLIPTGVDDPKQDDVLCLTSPPCLDQGLNSKEVLDIHGNPLPALDPTRSFQVPAVTSKLGKVNESEPLRISWPPKRHNSRWTTAHTVKMELERSMAATFITRYWALGLILVTAAWLIRNRYHNGLHKFPGPFTASLTDIWRLHEVWGRRFEVTHRKLHAQYGDVVRLGPNTLSFADPKALKTIYGLNKGFIKSDFYIVQQGVSKGGGLATLFSTTDNTFHAQLRRCVNSAFSMSALVQYEPFVNNTIKLFFEQTERLYVNNPEGCDFVRWLQFYAFDVIGEVTYSKRHGFLERNEDVDGIVSYLGNLFLYVAPVSLGTPFSCYFIHALRVNGSDPIEADILNLDLRLVKSPG